MKRLCAILVLTSFAAANAFATTYVRVEKDGTKTYSDRPLPGGQPVEIQGPQTYSAPPAAAPSTGVGLTPEQLEQQRRNDNFRYERCTLTPAPDQTFTNPEFVSISASLLPPLRAGDLAVLSVDGRPVATPNSLSFTLSPADRGSHTITLLVRDQFGRTLCNASSTFHVLRPSINSPARQSPPRPRS